MDMIPELEVKYEEDPDKSSDNLSDNEPEELEDDEIHYLSLQFLKQYSKGNSEWCQEFPEHGPSCRKCGQKGHTVIQCINPAKERCVFCGQYDHKHYNCPDSEQLEYKNFCIGCCYCGQSVSLMSFLQSAKLIKYGTICFTANKNKPRDTICIRLYN
jgi:hypothetical protein